MQHAKTFDFIVVGSGIAGLNAALTLCPFGKVLIVTKNKQEISSTSLAQGGIAAVTKKDDSLTSHTKDTITAGYNYNNKKAVDLLVKDGEKVVAQLIQFGVRFDKEKNGDFISSFEAAHSYPRILHATDFTGREIEKALLATVAKQKTITIWENTAAIDLIVKNKTCYGVQVLKRNKVQNLFARAVILATGGAGQLYQWTTNPTVATGDGIAIAQRAGAKLRDLEFIQFHPTALAENTSPLLLLSEALRGEGAVLLNHNHEPFMQNYHPQKELAPRDVVSRAIFQEQKKGVVSLTISHKEKKFIIKRFPNLSRELKQRGYDLTKDAIPVTPAAHFICGGIVTDLSGRTSIKNLFAYGEVAATGVHGANRLASNSLLEGMVFSSQIKDCVAQMPKKPQIIPTPQIIISKQEIKIAQQIREIMWQYVGILRTAHGLAIAQHKLELLKQQLANTNETNASLLKTNNMLTVGLLITKAAQKRKKSLGTHFLTSKQIEVKIKLVTFCIESDTLCVSIPGGQLPSETISETTTLDEQVEDIFQKHIGSPIGNNYVEQLYTFSKDKKEITIVYFALLAKSNKQTGDGNFWKKVTSKNNPEQQIISYAMQRLRWKIEYTNVVYSLLPRTFTLSDLQKTYEIILGKRLDKRNFRKKILSLKFLKPTGEKRTDNARPAQMYTFTKRSPMLVKVFS